MRYLCLIYGPHEPVPGAVIRDHGGIRAADLAVQDGAVTGTFEPCAAAVTIRPQASGVEPAGEATGRDAPDLTAFCLIEARDINRAIQVVSTIPAARTHRVEIRRLRE